MPIKPKYWKKEVWITIFMTLLVFYFMTISKLPGQITGAHVINEYTNCEWDYLTDEFLAKDVISLELDKYFYTERPLQFYVHSNDGEIFMKDNLMVFFPTKEYNTVTIIARNEGASCSRTIKIINALS